MKNIYLKSLALVAMLAGALTLSAEEENVNFALASNGATATATSGEAALAIDGNNGTRWESAQTDPQVFTLDLGQARQFNIVQILWEGAYGKTFTIEYSNDNDAWQTYASVEGQTLAGFPYTQNFRTDNPVTARYVRFTGTERGTQYGYSFWEFRVFLSTTNILTTLTATADAIAKVGEACPITIVAKNQIDEVMTDYGTVEYTVSPADAGSVTNGAYIPAKIGPATITAKVGDVVAPAISIFGYDGENVALSSNDANKVIAQSEYKPSGSDALNAVDGAAETFWQASPTNGTGDTEEERTYDAWFDLDLGRFYDINLISIQFEGACSQEYEIYASIDNTNWNLVYHFTGNAGINAHTDMIYGSMLQNNTSVRFLRYKNIKAATSYGMKMYELQVFATPGALPEDDEKPVMGTAVLESVWHYTATIAVSATDNLGIGGYRLKDDVAGYDRVWSPVRDTIRPNDLVPGTTYHFAISAVDYAENESENSVSLEVVVPAYAPQPDKPAPVPTQPADKVMSIYSDAYEPAWTELLSYNEVWWQNPSLEEVELSDSEHYLRYYGTMTGMVGWQFSTLDVSGMTHLHVDIWPSATGTITMGPTDSSIDGNNVVSVTLNVVKEQWNSFDIEIKTQLANLVLDKVFQNQFTGYAEQEQFSVDNVYFWNNGAMNIRNTHDDSVVTKTIENGQLVIIRDGVRYSVLGNVIR